MKTVSLLSLAFFSCTLASFSANVHNTHGGNVGKRSKRVDNELAERAGDPHLTEPWYVVDPYQQDHIRYHAYLSMAYYAGDPTKLCSATFKDGGFTLIGRFSSPAGQAGYMAIVPLMDKVVIVFGGYSDYKSLSWAPAAITEVPGCKGCTAAEGALELYRSAKAATDDFKLAKEAVIKTGHRFSVSGHGVGGSVAQIAALDLGARNLVHYSHSQGAPRVMNPAAVAYYDNLFQGESGQRAVSNNDYMALAVPKSSSLTHTGTAVHLTGPLDQYLANCYYQNENATCLGTGKSTSDHLYYFTPTGQCGSANKGF